MSGIPHIEDLAPIDFIYYLDNIEHLIITEKLDGANLIFGLDENGTFYTSRESKGGKRKYSMYEYGSSSSDIVFKSAHVALESVKSIIATVLQPNDQVEVEVFHGRQPNAIVYGSNRIVFIRMLSTSSSIKIRELITKLPNETISQTINLIPHEEYDILQEKKTQQVWKFSCVPHLTDIKLPEEVLDQIEYLKAWLNIDLSYYNNEHMPIWKILGLNLSKVPVAERDLVRRDKETYKKHYSDIVLSIKNLLIQHILVSRSPTLRDCEILPNENIGIEGIVLVDPISFKPVKLVDKKKFTALNEFNHAIRNEISGYKRKKISNISVLQDECSMVETLYTRIGNIVCPEMLIPPAHKAKVLHSNLGSIVEYVSTKYSTTTLRYHILRLIWLSRNELSRMRKEYMRIYQTFALPFPNGTLIKYSPEIHSRTLIKFMETKKALLSIWNAVRVAETPEEMILAAYNMILPPLQD